ncbi:MAG: prohibitin family protein [Ignavibacteriae bacterium]|nr:prohibitin family protein [Ignavibacteria bacterium]MBI3363374.1 prohibitin family protein [Ignavibacteriota bacterium]
MVALVAFIIWRASRKRAAESQDTTSRAGAAVSGAVTLIAGLLALSQCFTVIPAGHIGVVDFFGTVQEITLKSGINFVNPLAEIIKMSIQTQEIKETMDSPSKEGLTTQIEVSVLFHLNPDRAAEVYKTVGQNYSPVILEPQFRSVCRSVTALYEAKALYTSERGMLESLIFDDLKKVVEPRGVTIESTPMRRVGLPAGLSAAIEEKLRMEQESQRMQFVLTKERQEADRKRIEAQGISDFQKIVTLGISENLLRWKGIEATLKIAESNNTKVVIVGSGKSGLPIILDTK